MALNLERLTKQFMILSGVALWLMACSQTARPMPNSVVTSIPTPAPTATRNPLAAVTQAAILTSTNTPANLETQGLVRGQSCYPSQRPPLMRLYFVNVDGGQPVTVDLAEGETDFTLELPPGQYTAHAITVGTGLRGAYTTCGQDNAECSNQQLQTFAINPGQTTESVNLCDWYDPPGQSAPSVNADTIVVTTLQNMKLFTGPGLAYPTLQDVMPGGTFAQAVARNLYGDWLQIEHQTLAQPAWIYAPLTQVSGTVAHLPVANEAKDESALRRDQFTAVNWYASPNNEVVHFVGTIRDQQRNRINGYSVLLDNGTWSVLSHPTGASHHYPDIADGEWDLIINNAADAAGWWALTVVRYDCPDFDGGFNAQCKDFTPLSATKVVKVVYPDKHIISANWVCQYNCDQGLYVDAYQKP